MDTSKPASTIRIIVHPDKCIGAGHCVSAAPDIFSQNEDDGVVILLNACPSSDRMADVETAIRMCPTGVIEIQK